MFISYNSADKDTARLVAGKLAESGVDIWFDKWRLRPGDSITGGIESGITDCDAFILVWSTNAQQSNWVDTELRAALRKRVDDASFRVIPLMLDRTRLPTLVADYRGFEVTKHSDLEGIASQIIGNDDVLENATRLQTRLLELIVNEFPETDAIRSLFCSRCASDSLTPRVIHDPMSNEPIYEIVCNRCGCMCRTPVHDPQGDA